MQILNGRYGPYITDGKKNANLPKETTAEAITLEECLKLLAKAPAKKAGARKTAFRKKKA